MIRVNLLPPEHRPAQGTPIGHFLVILASILLALGGAGAWAWMHFVQLPGAKDLREARQSLLRTLEPRVEYSKSLEEELKVYRDRRLAIQTINRSRVLWSKKLDQFFDIVAAEQAGYEAWLDQLDVPNQTTSAARGGRGGAAAQADGGKFRFNARLAMRDVNEMPAQGSQFYKRIVGETLSPSEFFQDFLAITNPSISTDDDGSGDAVKLDPPVVGATRYELRLKPRDLGKPPVAATGGRPRPQLPGAGTSGAGMR